MWLIPDFTIGSGGHNTIFRTIFWLEKFGHNCDILICGKSHFKSKNKARKVIISHYFPLRASIDFLQNPQNFKSQNDVIISTSFDTCYYSASLKSDSKRFYFVHSFRAMPSGLFQKHLTCNHGEIFLAGIEYENIFGTQFHPEKSDKMGLKVIDNFINL